MTKDEAHRKASELNKLVPEGKLTSYEACPAPETKYEKNPWRVVQLYSGEYVGEAG